MNGHSDQLIALAQAALVALACGMAMRVMRQPPLVGYILAGVLVGPSMLGIVQNTERVQLLAELGVLMLLFVIGMELSLRAFRTVWRVALLCVALQILGSLALMLVVATLLDWSPAVGVLFGFILAVSSTAVAIKMLDDIGELRTRIGRMVVGVLIAQDIAVVPMMLIVANIVGAGGMLDIVVKVALSLALLGGVVVFLSRRQRLSLPFAHLAVGHVDLLPVMSLAYCFGAAAVSGLVGLSPAYGAFLAGLIIGNSNQRQPVLEVIEPIQSVLIMVFFVSIGMLLDLGYIWEHLGTVLVLMLIVVVFKTAMNVGILALLRQERTHALIGGFALSQIGEFSFLLAQIGSAVALISDGDYRLVVAVTVLSLMISPVWLELARGVERIADGQPVAAPVGQPRLLGRPQAALSRLADRIARRMAGRPGGGDDRHADP